MLGWTILIVVESGVILTIGPYANPSPHAESVVAIRSLLTSRPPPSQVSWFEPKLVRSSFKEVVERAGVKSWQGKLFTTTLLENKNAQNVRSRSDYTSVKAS